MRRLALSTILSLGLLVLACGGSERPAERPAVSPTSSGGRTPVSFIAEDMHSANPMLVVEDVASAMSFYASAFGAQRGLTLKSSDGSIMHSEVKLGDTVVMLSPAEPAADVKSPKMLGGTSGSLYYYVTDVDAVTKLAIDEGAIAISPAQDMFYGDRMTIIEDPSGHRWMLATHVEDVSPEVLSERSRQITEAMAANAPMPTFELATPAQSYRSAMAKHDVTLELVVKGGSDAIAFYKDVFGFGEVHRLAHPDGRLLHAVLHYGDSYIFVADAFPEMPGHQYYKAPVALGGNTVSLMLYAEDADSTFAKATQFGAKEKMPVTDMFWGDRYGEIVDPSGIAWGIATHVEDVPDSEMSKRMKEWMQKMSDQHGDRGAPPGEAPAANSPQEPATDGKTTTPAVEKK